SRWTASPLSCIVYPFPLFSYTHLSCLDRPSACWSSWLCVVVAWWSPRSVGNYFVLVKCIHREINAATVPTPSFCGCNT
uniref:Uncharacterized protein n=1 Tax=Oryzias latipes TaxID=8090 RepID=A0A3P9M4M3_ORYLA